MSHRHGTSCMYTIVLSTLKESLHVLIKFYAEMLYAVAQFVRNAVNVAQTLLSQG